MTAAPHTTISTLTLENVGCWLDEHGMGLDERRLYVVWVVLSRLIGLGSGDRAGLHNLTTPLDGLARYSFRQGGEHIAAPFPDVQLTAWPFGDQAKGWPQGLTALNRLGLTIEELDWMWDAALQQEDDQAVLPARVVCAFLPPPMWRMVAQVIEWGPAETTNRLRRFLMAEARRPSKWSPSGGTISRATLRHRYQLMRRLMRLLVDLNGLKWAYPGEKEACPELASWSTLPPRIDLDELGALDARTDRTAPPLHVVRLTLSGLLTELEEKRRTKTGRKGLLGLYRDTLLLSLLVVLGARVDAIRRIKPRDFAPNRRHKGPAIAIYPGKRLRRTEARWKPIPHEVADLLQEWLAFTGLDTPDHAQREIWMGRWAHPKAYGVPGPPSSTETLKQAAKRLIPHESDPTSDGYSPHTYRHLAEQLAKRYGHEWLNEHPDEVGRISDRVFADALLDHAWGESDVYGYSDLEKDRENFAGIASKGIWELVRTQRGARTAPDWDRRAAAQDACHRASEAVDRCADHITDLKATRSKFTNDLNLLEDQQPADDPNYAKLILQVLTISMDLDDAYEQRHQANQELQSAERELQAASAAQIPISDELSDTEHRARQNYPPAEVEEVDAADLPPVREWLTTREVAHAWEVSNSTAKNWFRGIQDPPFDPTEAVREKPRPRRLFISKVDLDAAEPDTVRRIRRLLAQPHPQGTVGHTSPANGSA